MVKLGLANETEGDGKKWKFIGLWSKNRWEWLATHIANMYFNNTSIGFFDSMGVQSVDYILKQTELICMFSSSDYIKKVCAMKKDGTAESIKYFVSFDPITTEDKKACEAVGVTIYSFQEVMDCGAQNPDIPFNKCG
jgi:long-chain acyl-CoA synthetase